MLSGESSSQQQKESFLTRIKSSFSVADAYATGGQVVAADQVNNDTQSNGETSQWQDNPESVWRAGKRWPEKFGDLVKMVSKESEKQSRIFGVNTKESRLYENG